ncbi:hypothetical protein [Streptomyces sp. NPDC001340]
MARPKTLCPADFAVMTTAVLLNVRHDLATPADQGEAQRMQWLGEVAGLQESLRHIADKKQQAKRLRAQTDRGENGVTALG